jgi:hypothetical protein
MQRRDVRDSRRTDNQAKPSPITKRLIGKKTMPSMRSVIGCRMPGSRTDCEGSDGLDWRAGLARACPGGGDLAVLRRHWLGLDEELNVSVLFALNRFRPLKT